MSAFVSFFYLPLRSFCLPLFLFYTLLCLFLRGCGHRFVCAALLDCVHHAPHSPQRYPPQCRNAGKVGMGELKLLFSMLMYLCLPLSKFRLLDGQFPQLSKLWQTQSDKSGQPEELSGAAEEVIKVDKRRSKRIYCIYIFCVLLGRCILDKADKNMQR